MLSQLVGVKGVPISSKIVLDIFEGQTLQRWGFDGRRPKKQQQKQQPKPPGLHTTAQCGCVGVTYLGQVPLAKASPSQSTMQSVFV